MRIRFWIGLLVAFLNLGVYAQSITDTIQIEEIITYGSYKKFQAGAKIEEISAEQMQLVQEGGIDQLLARFSPVYVKSNAGGIATIHIRGTAASHTSIMYGGMNINLLTLGQANLSNITSFLFDKMEIQYGSSAALNGSGAIGGAIYLGEHNYWTNGFRLKTKYSLGSFGENLIGVKLYLGNGKWESVTKLLKYKINNNFTYINQSGFENRDGKKEIQKNAAVDNKGLIQQFNYLFGSNEYFKSSIWYEDSWHEIQPGINENEFSQNTVTVLKDNNVRFWAEYRNENNSLRYTVGVAYVHNNEIYNNNSSQFIQTTSYNGNFSLKQQIMEKMEYETGAKYSYIVPQVYAYSNTAEINEHDADFYFTWFYQPVEKLKTTVNLRQQLVSNYKAPFTPAFGMEYNWLKAKTNAICSSVNLSKSYRIPTLNDRYWPTAFNPLGTPLLLPENGYNIESGLKYNYTSATKILTLQVNAFYMNIKNWLEWRNLNGPVPVNLDKVISKGIECHAEMQIKTGKITTEFRGNYTYNPSLKIEENKPDQQLIYIPKNMFNAFGLFQYKNISLSIDGSYTGERYYDYISKSTQNRKALSSFFLTNCNISYKFIFKAQPFICSFSANNLFNVSYQNQLNYAMPGINFRAGISTNIKFNNNNKHL